MTYKTTHNAQHIGSNAIFNSHQTQYSSKNKDISFSSNYRTECGKTSYYIDLNKSLLIGDGNKLTDGSWFCENIEQALAIYSSAGDGKNTLNNAQQYPVILCDEGCLSSVVIEHAKQGFDNIHIIADVNKLDEQYQSLMSAYHISAKHYYVFDSTTFEFNKISVPTNTFDYLVALTKLAPTQNELDTCLIKMSSTIAASVPSKMSLVQAVDKIAEVFASRNIDVKSKAYSLIKKSVDTKIDFIHQFNRISDYTNCTKHQCDNLSISEISAIIERENKQWRGAMFIDTRGMGAGKTNLMALQIQSISTCAYITHRVALIDDACQRLNLINYKEGDRYADKIAVCINSLMQFASAVREKPLFIDEARQVYDTIINSSTIDKRKDLIKCFQDILLIAPSVHIADAGMNSEALDFYRKYAGIKKLHVIETTTQKRNINHWKLDSLDACRVNLLKDVKQGRRGIVACTSENEVLKTKKYLINNGIKSKRILVITGSNKGNSEVANFLSNVNEEGRKYDVIIHTSVLGSGVSIEIPDFSFTYLLCSNILTSNESMQMLARNRCATDISVAFGSQMGRNRVSDVDILKQGQIDKLKNFADNEGFQWLECIEPIVIFQEIDERIHQLQANINKDLNDFANHFLLLAEIEGRNFVSIEQKTESMRLLSKEIKEDLINAIQSAPVIDEANYKSLKKMNVLNNVQSASIKRYEVSQMTGLPNRENTPPAVADINNYLNGYGFVLANYELLSANSHALKIIDTLNYQERTKSKSLLSRQKIFRSFLKSLENAEITNGGLTKPDLLKALAVLEKFAPELASDFGNYTDINPIRVASIIKNFAKRFGYQLECIGREGNGQRNRIYKLKVIDEIANYANNRKGLRKEYDVH